MDTTTTTDAPSWEELAYRAGTLTWAARALLDLVDEAGPVLDHRQQAELDHARRLVERAGS